jgi:hypothetical protein
MMAEILDGIVEQTGAVFEAKFMLPWAFTEETAAEKHMAQLQHNMWVTAARTAVLLIITGGGKWVEMTIPADPLSSTSCSQPRRNSGAVSRPPRTLTSLALSPPRQRIEAVRTVDMSGSKAWAEFAGLLQATRQAETAVPHRMGAAPDLCPALCPIHAGRDRWRG